MAKVMCFVRNSKQCHRCRLIASTFGIAVFAQARIDDMVFWSAPLSLSLVVSFVFSIAPKTVVDLSHSEAMRSKRLRKIIFG